MKPRIENPTDKAVDTGEQHKPSATNPWSGVIDFSGQTLTKRKVLRTWQGRIFLLTWITYAAYYFPRNAFSAAKVGMLEEGVMSREALGVLDSVYLAAYAVGQFFWGPLPSVSVPVW